jgi:hypothetical protein
LATDIHTENKMVRPKMLQHMVLDTSRTVTEMCALGRACQFTRSPYNEKGEAHPYTAIYSLFMAPLRDSEFEFAEIGTRGPSSALFWTHYFRNARHSFFGPAPNELVQLRLMGILKPYTGLVNWEQDGETIRGLAQSEKKFDRIVCSGPTQFDQQVRLIREAFPFLNSGGVLILEFLDRTVSEETIEKELAPILRGCALATSVVLNHENRVLNTDRALVLMKAV